MDAQPYAREGWWYEYANRGRPLAGLISGTATGAPGEDHRWPSLDQLSPAVRPDRLEGLDALADGALPMWDPLGEARLARGGEDGRQLLQSRWQDGLRTLEATIIAEPADTLAVVCHWGVMKELWGVASPNCGVLRTWWWTDEATGQLRRAMAPNGPAAPPLEASSPRAA